LIIIWYCQKQIETKNIEEDKMPNEEGMDMIMETWVRVVTDNYGNSLKVIKFLVTDDYGYVVGVRYAIVPEPES
jgi:hypothetical protein